MTTLMLGHRGFSAAYPENTLLAFEKAYEFGCGFEFDVRKSSDGVLCVMHDTSVDRTTNGTGNVADLTWDYISRLDAGSKFNPQFAGEHVPSLENVLDYFNGKDIFICIDNHTNDGAAIVQMIQNKHMEHQVLIHSSYKAAYQTKDKCSRLKVGIGGAGSDILLYKDKAVGFGLDYLSWPTSYLTAEIVAEIQASGLKILTNNPATLIDIQAAVDMGVDWIMSDHCDLLAQIVESNSIIQEVPVRTFATGEPKFYNGVSFKTAKLKVYNNGMFKEKIIKV